MLDHFPLLLGKRGYSPDIEKAPSTTCGSGSPLCTLPSRSWHDAHMLPEEAAQTWILDMHVGSRCEAGTQ